MGMAFMALLRMAPRNMTWAKKGKWVHPAKIALEKYFLMKMKKGVSEPFFKKAILNAMGINKREKASSRDGPSVVNLLLRPCLT
jgi:sulfide:quinone oxidoreductase